ncbi:MAG: hypothetical protein QM628_15610 [Propionicimonas sp.]
MDTQTLTHELPSWAMATIRDGVPERDLARNWRRAIWAVLVPLAMTAQTHGLSQAEFEQAINQHGHVLRTQLRIRRRQQVPPVEIRELLDGAWQQAAKFHASRV